MLCMLVNMDIEIVKEKDNPFLKRREMVLLLKHPKSATPAKSEVIKNVANNNSVDESQVVIDCILTQNGICESIVKLKILKEKPKIKPEAKQGENIEAQTSKAA